jgi:hypothetical protein
MYQQPRDSVACLTFGPVLPLCATGEIDVPKAAFSASTNTSHLQNIEAAHFWEAPT